MNIDKTEQEQRFLKFDTPRRLASIASNLIHVVRAADNGSDTLPLRLFNDAKLYIQWTLPDCSEEAEARLTQLSELVDHWRVDWQESQHEPDSRSAILALCKQWHDELLGLSGLLVSQ